MADVKNIKTAKAEKPAKKESNAKKRSEAMRRYLIETKAEFKKIVWPAPKQILNNTIVVIVMIIAVGAVIWALDALSSSALSVFFGKYA